MDERDFAELKMKWEKLLDYVAENFKVEPDLQGVIFLIGVQELGAGGKKFGKDEKQDLMHIATCKLLSRYGYYELEGADEEGWPYWKNTKPLPPLTLKEQDLLLRQPVIAY